MKTLRLLWLLPFFSFGQIQIGQDIEGIGANNFFGRSMALSGNGEILAAAGRTTNGSLNGYVRVYQKSGGTWTQVGANILSQTIDEYFGVSISLSFDGNTLAVGSPFNDVNGQNSGQVQIFKNNLGVWNQVGQTLQGSNASSLIGVALSMSSNGNILSVSSGENSSRSVIIYENLSGIWTQIGPEINFGTTISLSSDGSVIAIGAYQNNGQVKIYQNLNGIYSQIGQDIIGEDYGDNLGTSVSLSADGRMVAIGAVLNNGNGQNSGHTRIYQYELGVWTQIGQDIDGEAAGDLSGSHVSLSSAGTIVAIGAQDNSANGQASGHVRIYRNLSGNWTQIGQDIDGEAMQDRADRVSMSSDGNTVAIGAAENTGTNYHCGHVRVYDISLLKSDQFVLENFSIHPNPVSEILNINLNENLELQKANIYTTSGQLLKTENANNFKINDLATGTYFIEVITNKGKATKTIIVK